MRYSILSLVLAGLLATTAGISRADEWNKKTEITLNERILIPGKELPPGKYVMKLADSSSNRNIVQIFNEDESQLQAMILAIPNYRVQPQDDTTLTFWETPAGAPPALRAWFYPGDTFGQEFAYPKEMAARFAEANQNAAIPQYEGDAELSAEEMAKVDVENEPEAPVQSAQARPATQPQAEVSQAQQEQAAPQEEAANRQAQDATQRPVAPAPVELSAERSSDESLLAQNTPQPQPLPSLNQSDQAGEPTELPRTASPAGWILLAGLAAGAGALVLRRLHA